MKRRHVMLAQRWQRFWGIAPIYFASVARREWQLVVLALGGLAPGVAALVAWTCTALYLNKIGFNHPLRAWLLPGPLLDLLGAQGVLVGAGMVTLLIGCLSLTTIYLASVTRRSRELGMLMSQGLSRAETLALLLLEILAIGLLGCVAGAISGALLTLISGQSALSFFGVDSALQLPLPSLILLWFRALWFSLWAGMLAAILFMGLAAIQVVMAPLSNLLHGVPRVTLLDTWQGVTTTACGALFTWILTLVVALLTLSQSVALMLSALALLLAGLLSGGGWLLANLYRRLPTPGSWPLWSLAVQGLARHPNHTAAVTLALTSGSYGAGLAALGLLNQGLDATFTFWVAGMIMVAGAGLVLTIAALSALERRWEFGLLMALGARAGRVWRLILLEYAIVAMGAGSLGGLMALVNWAGSHGGSSWLSALGLIAADLLAALFSAWAGAAPVLWRVTRRTVGQAVR